MSKTLSLIIPAFNEEEVAKTSFARMDAAMKAIGYDYEIIYVDDGSRDNTLSILKSIAAEHPYVRVLSFSRNFGHQLAVTAGMDAAKGDALIIIDIDLQDPPEVIAQMVAAWEQGADIAYGKRIKREGETFFKRFTAKCYYRLLAAMSAYPIPLDTGDFRLISRAVADEFLRMREHHRFLRGMSAWMGFHAVAIEYVRHERAAGQSKYPLRKMLKLAADGIFAFSDKPLTLIAALGCTLTTATLAGIVALIICALTIGVAPWLWAVAAILLTGGLNLTALGILGAYVGRMYDELKGRPLYIVKEKINFDE